MSKGKFSSPRPRREEDPEIRRAYRQMTGQESIPDVPASDPFTPPKSAAPGSVPTGSDAEVDLSALLSQSSEVPPRPDTPDPAPHAPKKLHFFPEEEPMEEEPEEDDDSDDESDASGGSFLDKALNLCNRVMDFCYANKKIALIALCGLALVVIVGVISVFFASTSDPYDRKILNNVYVAGVNVGGLTKKEAITLVRQSADTRLAREYMTVSLAGSEVRISPADASVKLDVKGAVNAAYDYGRKGTNAEKEQAYLSSQSQPYTVPLSPYLDINKRKIQEALDTFAATVGTALTQTQYGLEGTQPELSADQFDKNAPGQTLVITMGTPGIQFDTDAVLDQILDAYSRFEFQITVDNAEPTSLPDPLDLDAVYLEFYIAPVDASIDPTTYETIPASYGYGFDVEEAKRLVAEADYGEEIRISMTYITPEVMDDELLYRDILGEHQTAFNRSENRTINIRLACEALDGAVVNPGEVFSFNDHLGQPTSGKGYKYAFVGTGVEEESVLGGGISQVASTLYYCALLSDLEISSRTNHDHPVSYIEYGLDADIQWGRRDLRLKNNTDYPITIHAEVSNSNVSVRILGTDQRDYYVKLESRIQNTYLPDKEYKDYPYDNDQGYKDGDVLQEGQNGYLVRTYLRKYDRRTNELISRDSLVDSRYDTTDEIIARVEAEPTTAPTTPPTEKPTETTTETTAETTTATTQSTVATTEASVVTTESESIDELEAA